MRKCLSLFASLVSVALLSSTSQAGLPDNGFGTADMPLHGPYVAAPGDTMDIIDGLGAGNTVEMVPVLITPTATQEVPGGSLFGTMSAGEGSGFQWQMQGTGSLSGYTRNLFMPLNSNVASFPNLLTNPGYEVHAAPRTLNSPLQSFDTAMFRMFGQITGDPDFDLLRLVAGTDFGLPSPGHTTLFADGMGGWNVDSFFDLTYRIDFVGRPGGPFGGQSGSTTGTIHIFLPEPASLSVLAGIGLLALRRIRV